MAPDPTPEAMVEGSPCAPQGGASTIAFVGGLARRLRERGVRVGTGEVLAAHRALGAVDAADPRQARAALRAVLCSKREDLAAFDLLWDGAWAGRGQEALAELQPGGTGTPPRALPEAGGEERPDDLPEAVPNAASAVELLRDRDLASLTPQERAAVEAAVRRIVVAGPFRRSRRTRAARRGTRLDLRATLGEAVRSGGLERRFRAPVTVQRPLVLLVDVSGSMAPYARMLLTAAQAAVTSRPRVEAFAFGTRLTRLTLDLRTGDLDGAMAAARDWAGGTRIGEALAALNREHGRRLGRGAVVVLLSDGWDRGDPDQLAAEMARLRRCAHRVVWVNPLSAAPGFEPLTRGLRAALPHADVVLSGHSLRALEDLVAVLEEA